MTELWRGELTGEPNAVDYWWRRFKAVETERDKYKAVAEIATYVAELYVPKRGHFEQVDDLAMMRLVAALRAVGLMAPAKDAGSTTVLGGAWP